jgi:hypothetical protein
MLDENGVPLAGVWINRVPHLFAGDHPQHPELTGETGEDGRFEVVSLGTINTRLRDAPWVRVHVQFEKLSYVMNRRPYGSTGFFDRVGFDQPFSLDDSIMQKGRILR